MSNPDDDLLEAIKDLTGRKDFLEERVFHLETKEDTLKAALLNPIIDARDAIAERHYNNQPGWKSPTKANYLQNAFVTVRNWVKKTEKLNADRVKKKQFDKSLNKAISWASVTNPEEEDIILRELLGQTLTNALVWVKRLQLTENEKDLEEQLEKSLTVAVNWTSAGGGDDEVMVQSLADYIIIASNWTKSGWLSDGVKKEQNEQDEVIEALTEDNELERYENEVESRQELQQCLQDMFDWIKSIIPTPRERGFRQELLDSLEITKHWARTMDASRDDEVMRQLLQEILILALNWVMIVEEDEDEEKKKQLIDSLIFGINWAAGYDFVEADAVMRLLLQRILQTAKEWKKALDHETSYGRT